MILPAAPLATGPMSLAFAPTPLPALLPPAAHQLSTQLALVPVAPLLLLPLILVVFVVFAPLWGAALLVIAVLRAIFWPIERVLAALHVPGAGEASEALARASRWVSTLGGLTDRYAASRQQPHHDQQYQPEHAHHPAADGPGGPGA